MVYLLRKSARIHFVIVSLAVFSLLTGCAFVSKATVAVSGNCPGCEDPLTDDAVAVVVAPVLERHGLQPVWAQKKSSGPCTGARGCSWAPEGKGGLQPWVLVSSASSGQVKIQIETRHDAPRHDSRVSLLAEGVANTLRAHFGRGNVVIERLN